MTITIVDPTTTVEQLPPASGLVTTSQVGQPVIGGGLQWGTIPGNIQTQLDLQQEFAVQAGIAQSNLTAHTANVSNPHQVTKAQVGLSLVQNYSPDSMPISTATVAAIALATGPTLSIVDTQISNSSLAGRAMLEAASAAAQAALLTYPGRLLGVTVYNASGTHVPNALTKTILYELIGAGGGGGGSIATNGSGGSCAVGSCGSNGTYIKGITTIIATQTITVGAGGTIAFGGAGGLGGSSSYGTIAIAPGGPGGVSSAFYSLASGCYSGGSGGSSAGTGGNIISASGAYSQGLFFAPNFAPWGQSGYPSIWGGQSGLVGYSSEGVPGGANSGAGGSGTANYTASALNLEGGLGGSGKVIIYEFS